MPDYTIIIAGAGPAGCALALYLANAGVTVLLLEAEAELPLDLRASTFHPPTLDMRREILDEFPACGECSGVAADVSEHPRVAYPKTNLRRYACRGLLTFLQS